MGGAFTPGRGLIFLTAELVGPAFATEVRLALDTGARQTIISTAMLEFVRCDLARPVDHIGLVSVTGTARAPRVVVPRLSCAGTTRTGFLVAARAFPRGFRGDGLLGLDFIRPGPLHVDFRRGTVRLGPRRWWPFAG